MVVIEMKATEQRFSINRGRIVDGDMQHASMVRKIAKEVEDSPSDGDPDYCIAQEFVAFHGGRIVQHEYTNFDPDVIY